MKHAIILLLIGYAFGLLTHPVIWPKLVKPLLLKLTGKAEKDLSKK